MTPELEDAIRNIGLVLSQAHITLKGNPLTGAEHLSLFNAHKLMVDKIQEGLKAITITEGQKAAKELAKENTMKIFPNKKD